MRQIRRLHFLVRAFDHPDVLPRRMLVRPDHLKRASAAHENGTILSGGALLDPSATDLSASLDSSQNPPKMIGSFFVLDFPDEKACREWIMKDPYVTGRVWDLNRIEIHPIKLAKH